MWPDNVRGCPDGCELVFQGAAVQYTVAKKLGRGLFGTVHLITAEGHPSYAVKVFANLSAPEVVRELAAVDALGSVDDSPMIPARRFGEVVLMPPATPLTNDALEAQFEAMDSEQRLSMASDIVKNLVDMEEALTALGYLYTDMKADNLALTDDHDLVMLDYGGLCLIGSDQDCTGNILTVPPQIYKQKGQWKLTPRSASIYGRFMAAKVADSIVLQKDDLCPRDLSLHLDESDPKGMRVTNCTRYVPGGGSPVRRLRTGRVTQSSPSRESAHHKKRLDDSRIKRSVK